MNLCDGTPKALFNAYVDGFNLYKGALENRSDLKWLDLKGLCASLCPDKVLNQVYYFTSPLKDRFPGDSANERQNTYLRVLRHSGVKVVNGNFRNDASWQRLASSSRTEMIQPPLPKHFGLSQLAINDSWDAARPDIPKARILMMKEKGSDVNLASYLLRDAYQGSVSHGLVITGDSDLSTAISFAREAGMFVKVGFPNKDRISKDLRSRASTSETIHMKNLRSNQFATTFIAPNGRQIVRPSEWAQKPLNAESQSEDWLSS